MGQPQLSSQPTEQPAVGSSGACASEKQQLESIKSWPGWSISGPGSGPLAWITHPPWESLTCRDGRAARAKQGATIRGAEPLVASRARGRCMTWRSAARGWLATGRGAWCPPHMCTGQMLWLLRRGQRACRSHYPGPLGKQLEKNHLVIWTGVRLQNGSCLCDSLPRTD